MRAINDSFYAQWLLNMGNGTLLFVEGTAVGTIKIPETVMLKKGQNLIIPLLVTVLQITVQRTTLKKLYYVQLMLHV